MTFHRRAMGPTLMLLALLAAAGAHPRSAHAQDTAAAATQQMDRDRITRFARTHLGINDARDEFHGAVARVHDEEGRLRAREDVEANIEAILEENEMTREEYDELILLISLDGELRAMFEEIVAELENPSDPD